MPLAVLIGVGLETYLALLFMIDLVTSPIGGPGACPTTPTGFHNPFCHTAFMLRYAGKLTTPDGPQGIASCPWKWLLNDKPINYYRLSTNVFRGGKQVATHPVIDLQGVMNPATILLALPRSGCPFSPGWGTAIRALLALAWFTGTSVPFVLAAAPLGPYGRRTSYLYYMVVVLP